MKEKVFLNIFILCVIFSEGIVGTFLENDIGESSNLLVREKRVINRIPGEDLPVELGDVPYLVNIKKYNRVYCIGTILSHLNVITAARCVDLESSVYTLFTGSRHSHLGTRHNITEKKLHGHNPSRAATFKTGIALLTVNPPIVFSRSTNKIELHAGLVLAGMHSTISGWGGYCYGGPSETRFGRHLRSISVPIMNHRECQSIYRGYFPISDEDICTYHPQKLCGYTDAGAPLVINNELVGVHIGGIETEGRVLAIKPDIFALLQHSEYRLWLRENIA